MKENAQMFLKGLGISQESRESKAGEPAAFSSQNCKLQETIAIKLVPLLFLFFSSFHFSFLCLVYLCQPPMS